MERMPVAPRRQQTNVHPSPPSSTLFPTQCARDSTSNKALSAQVCRTDSAHEFCNPLIVVPPPPDAAGSISPAWARNTEGRGGRREERRERGEGTEERGVRGHGRGGTGDFDREHVGSSCVAKCTTTIMRTIPAWAVPRVYSIIEFLRSLQGNKGDSCESSSCRESDRSTIFRYFPVPAAERTAER